ncbi:hypothetical protein KBC75_05185 [Candidatus Shapirobacteria bacterium]|nr:hypothetical protein [Candidatus Shapirobacteria bacterium]
MFYLYLFLNLTSYFLLLATPAAAQCPVCIVTVGGGMLIAKKLGIDDFLVSIWISALNTAISFWLATKITFPKNGSMVKWFNFFKNPWLFSILMLLLTLSYFQFTDQLWHSSNKLLGLDKVVFGQTLGMVVMFAGNLIYGFTKYKNNGKALFPYSKVVFPVGLVLLTTLVFKLFFKL